MILRFRKSTPPEVVQQVIARCDRAGIRTARSSEPLRPILALLDKLSPALEAELLQEATITEVVKPKGDLRMAHRAFAEGPSTVRIGRGEDAVAVGGGNPPIVIAGPCSVEGRDFMQEVAAHVAAAGARILRGGAYKPRTSPYAFQGFGVEGLAQLKAAGERHHLPVCAEIMDAAHLPAFEDYDIDLLQVGARNMQNFTLLKAIGSSTRAVLLKRGLAATVEEWLYAAEYLCAHGSSQVILCERGIRTFETATRNTLDLTILPVLRELTHFPVIVDPAHAVGIARFIPPLARASIACGADGLTVEVHPRPEEARSDGPQALLPAELIALVAEVRMLGAVLLHGS